MNVRKIDTNEFGKRKLERSYISVYIVIKSIDVETSRALEIQLKNLLLADNIDMCKEKIELFKQEYLHNKLVLSVFEKQEPDILNLYKYNYDIRKLLYQYYAIRDIKRQIN